MAGSIAGTAFVVAHFDRNGGVAAYLSEFVRYLHAQQARVVFVSTHLRPDVQADLAPYAQVIARENVGYDFWSYKLGIDALGDLAAFERIVILNSSFLILDPALLCERFFGASGQADLLSLTHCHEISTHLQSYWVCFNNRAVIASPAFTQWWADMVPISERSEVIRRYEVGMSVYFGSRGMRLASVYARSRKDMFLCLVRALGNGNLAFDIPASGDVALNPEIGNGFNPTAFNWDALLERFGIVKLELLGKNPQGINTVPLLRALASSPQAQRLLADVLPVGLAAA